MPKNKGFVRRIEIIDECLQNKYRKWTLSTLIEKVNKDLLDKYGTQASKHTIQNDLKYLREEKDAPIQKYRDGNTVYFFYSDTKYSIRKVALKEEDLLLKNNHFNLRQISEIRMQSAIESTIYKLQSTATPDSTTNSDMIHFENHTFVPGTEYIEDIFIAIKNKTCLKITYHTVKSAARNEYIFHPYLLKEYLGRWFVFGRLNKQSFISSLSLNRIKKIKSLNKPYIENDIFSPSSLLEHLIGVTMPTNAEVEIVGLWASPKLAPHIKATPIHHTQNIVKEFKNGALLIQLSLIINYELKSTLLSYGCDLKVETPLSLRSEMRSIFKTGLHYYNNIPETKNLLT